MSDNATTGLLGTLGGVTVTPMPAEGDLLAPTPLAGVLVGYGRVSPESRTSPASKPH
ncbi:hypothetical protein [Micromonospora sp. M71_S20]|uniref:hypothetical protein n=1 Tax=Micromonospora sp. M71_S20 TaxID=592872 RepID=UPI001F1F38B0|nr:hypothetical protein [Micromonospora sp. M71_S20]